MACTFVNSLIAVVLAAVAGVALAVFATTQLGVVAAATVLVLSAVSIYFRGYLIPGTPTLTKRYFPNWFLAYFEKSQTAPNEIPDEHKDKAWAHTYRKFPKQEKDGAWEPRTEVDAEAKLLEAGALEECEDADDLCLTDDFKADWERDIERATDEDASRDRLIRLLDLEDADIEFKEYDSGFRVVANGRFAGRWESQAAFVADVAAGELLEDRLDDWNELGVKDRGAVLNGLRLFVETCPDCGGPVSMNTRLIESCCAERQVAALTCDECEARLFESNAMEA